MYFDAYESNFTWCSIELSKTKQKRKEKENLTSFYAHSYHGETI